MDKYSNVSWWLGQIAAALIAGALWPTFGGVVALSVGYALLLLVDIRFALDCAALAQLQAEGKAS